jgi:hypothetical protein
MISSLRPLHVQNAPHTNKTDEQSCPHPDSNLQSQQSVSCKPTPQTVWPPRSAMILYDISHWWMGMDGALVEWYWQGNIELNTRGKISLSATLLSTEHIWTGPGSNPRMSGETPATNPSSHGPAFHLEGAVFFNFVWVQKGLRHRRTRQIITSNFQQPL